MYDNLLYRNLTVDKINIVHNHPFQRIVLFENKRILWKSHDIFFLLNKGLIGLDNKELGK